MYTFQITDIPIQTDPSNMVVTATLTDDSDQPTIIRNYQLPTLGNPQPSDFSTLIQTDCDLLNNAQQAQVTLAQSFSSQSAIPVDQSTLTAILDISVAPGKITSPNQPVTP